MRTAVIGAGISGIGAANVLQKNGYDSILFEKSTDIGGVWAIAYPGIRLQNTAEQYHLPDFPWPFTPDQFPTGTQIRRYLHQAVDHLGVDIRLQHEVLALKEHHAGWLVRYRNNHSIREELFDYVIVANGQYTGGKHRPAFAGEERFAGDIITERDVNDLGVFDGKRVVVVGFGESAVDMATLAAPRAAQVHQVFRTPRWLVPLKILGINYTRIVFSRFGSVMLPSWAHPTASERFLHTRLAFFVDRFWDFLALIFRLQIKVHGLGRGRAARRRLQTVIPRHKIVGDVRSATAVAPDP